MDELLTDTARINDLRIYPDKQEIKQQHEHCS